MDTTFDRIFLWNVDMHVLDLFFLRVSLFTSINLATITVTTTTTMMMRLIQTLLLALWVSASLVEADKVLRGNRNVTLDISNNSTQTDRHLGGYRRLPRYRTVHGAYHLRRCQADCGGYDSHCAGDLVCRYAAGNPDLYSRFCRGHPNPGLDYCVPYVREHHRSDDDRYGNSNDDHYGGGGGGCGGNNNHYGGGGGGCGGNNNHYGGGGGRGHGGY
jgi:uncharacterized membrane protein YgcG